jgi:hypothetical protein
MNQNPNEEEYKEIVEAVESNEGYCPCALTKDDDTKCMCKEFRESDDTDFCHCGRFYKVKNYETLALLGDVSEDESALHYIDWHERFIHQDFVVLGIPLNLYDMNCGSVKHFNLCKAIIAKSDALIVLGHDQKLYSMIADLIEWAGFIGKKVLTREDLVK